MRRATMSAPGSPWIRASSAEASSDLIGGIRYRLAVQLPHLAFLTRHLLAPLCQELVDGRDRVTQQLAGQALRTPHRGLACHQGDDPFFLDTDDELVPLGEPRLLPNRRGQSYSAVLREAAAHDIPASAVEAMIEAVLARLRGAGYLDDDRYAAAKARSLAGRGRSQAAIRATLARKGVGRETATAAVAALREEGPDPELAAAVALARRRRPGPWQASEERAATRQRNLG